MPSFRIATDAPVGNPKCNNEDYRHRCRHEIRTLKSYLDGSRIRIFCERLEPRLARHRRFVADLVEVNRFQSAGWSRHSQNCRPRRQLSDVIIGHVQTGEYPIGMHTAPPPTRPPNGTVVTVFFASHEQVICTAHQRWTGSSALRFPVREQFSVRNPCRRLRRTPRTPFNSSDDGAAARV